MDMHERVDEDEVSLLDLLVVVAENIKLLILGPLVVGVLALAAGMALPPKYISSAIVAMPAAVPAQAGLPNSTLSPARGQELTPAQVAVLMTSPAVLDSVVETLELAHGAAVQAAGLALASQVKATVGKDQLLRLDVTADAPAQAQALAKAVLASWLKNTIPSAQERANLETRLGYAQKSLDSVTRMLTQSSTGVGPNLVVAADLQARYLTDVVSLTKELQGLSPDVVVQAPTLPTEPAPSKKKLVALLAALGSGFVLLLFVFMRQAWRQAALDPEAAEKQVRLRAALGLN